MIKTKAMTLAGAVLLAAVLALPSGAARAQRAPDTCLGNVLRLPSVEGVDLKVDRPCTVNAGTYKFGNVNIIANGSLTFSDATIDFWTKSILIENGGTLAAGTLENPIGTAGGRLTIHLWGKDQTGTDPSKQGQGITCLSTTSTDPCGIPGALWNSNLGADGMPVPPESARKISEVSGLPPYPPGRDDDYFYAYMPLPYDGARDAVTQRVGYFGYKVLGVSYGGSLQLYGKKGGTYAKLDPGCLAPPSTSGSSWARLTKTVTPTDTAPLTVQVDRTLTLKKGDRIVVTTTDYLPGHSEERTVADDVSCSNTFKVNEKFSYIHNGETYPLDAVRNSGRVVIDPNLTADTRAAVGVLTRSIRIVSEGDDFNTLFETPPDGIVPPGYQVAPPTYHFGGHVVARQGFKTFQVQGVEFYQMGQGGRISHYPVHFHHARRTAPGTFVRDSSIHDSMTRWIVLHGTQDVALERNVGYKSIGHGFYLEDGTEINNTLTANLGVFARAAVDNGQNPRKVPGILAAPDLTTPGDNMPYRSDYDHPTVFWIMNAWNDFTDNMAAGAGACGVCYWLLPGANSTMSREMKWASYASIQTGTDRAGMAPLKSFVGNSCSTAMTSFQTITATEACQGIGPPGADATQPNLPPIVNVLAPRARPPEGADAGTAAKVAAAAAAYYPTLGDGGHFPTRCTTDDCSTLPVRCSAGHSADCMVTVLDHYTTSFNWAPFNFAAIWLRPQWYLVTDSVITDVQQAGLTMVTGGGYSESDVIPGHWALVRKSVFIGNTQDCPTCAITANPYASNGGPFNPDGLRCAMTPTFNRPGAYCLSVDEGVSHQVSNFGMYQRLFSVYDGPAFQDSNAYLNIRQRAIDDCSPFLDSANKVGRCDPPDLSPGQPRQSAWVAGIVQGLPKATPAAPAKPFCYMPNAAIGWKQPNGFYYPPAFHSLNLFFKDVDTRHFVISPLFEEGTTVTDTDKVADAYCVWDRSLFTGFAGNDRQTVLNDDDGTLTGYRETTVINLDDFFSAPVDALQCRSDKTSRTSPYEYVTTVIYPACVYGPDGHFCARAATDDPPNPYWNDGDWNRACTNENCYGIPLWRQDRMPIADKGTDRSIRMMGQETGQRSTLTVNNGTYYIDTTVDKTTQLTQECTSTDPENPCVVNVFQKNQSYYLFLIFAKETTRQTYRFYVGDPSFNLGSVKMTRGDIGKNPIVWDPPEKETALKPGRARWYNNDPLTGVVEVELVLADVDGIADAITAAEKKKCQPATYCTWNGTANNGLGRCEGVTPSGLPSGDNSVCQWANADLDCPDGGCVGIRFTLPDGFATRPANDPRPNPRPPAQCVTSPGPWDASLDALKVSDEVCPVETDKLPPDFCAP